MVLYGNPYVDRDGEENDTCEEYIEWVYFGSFVQ